MVQNRFDSISKWPNGMTRRLRLYLAKMAGVYTTAEAPVGAVLRCLIFWSLFNGRQTINFVHFGSECAGAVPNRLSLKDEKLNSLTNCDETTADRRGTQPFCQCLRCEDRSFHGTTAPSCWKTSWSRRWKSPRSARRRKVLISPKIGDMTRIKSDLWNPIL